ncbi:hypothetical protein ES703_98704 [subsurface metagenome]
MDQELARALAASSEFIQDNEQPHLPEHSLEVQLPFLQRALHDVPVVPVLVTGPQKTMNQVARAILTAITETYGSLENILFVVSTDLAHYPEKEDALQSDSEILQAFCSLDGDALLNKNRELMSRDIQNLGCAMCALDAAYVGLKIVEALGANEAVILHRSVSSDAGIQGVTEEEVVGYGAVAVFAASPETMRFDLLNEKEKQFLLAAARRSMEAFIRNGAPAEISMLEESSSCLHERRGAFVTLYKDGELRGCTGDHSGRLPLYQLIPQLALTSAVLDPRFPPLTEEELGSLRIEISVYLSRVTPIAGIEEFCIGKHGIILQKGERSATFLPRVAAEQGWDKQTALHYLCIKAGLHPEAWK